MSEFPCIENREVSKIPRDELLRNADRLFDNRNISYKTLNVTHYSVLKGMVAAEVDNALRSEQQRAVQTELENQKLYKQQWRQRSLAKIVADLLWGHKFIDGWPITDPTNDLGGNLDLHTRAVSGELDLGGAWKNGPSLQTNVEERYLEGVITVNNRDFKLDPNAKMLQVNLRYPLSDGSTMVLGVTHTLYPYLRDVQTETQKAFGDYRSGVPSQPFADTPTDASVYINRALEMLDS